MFNFLTKKNSVLEDALLEDPLLLDVRTAAEVAEGTVSGSTNIPLDELEARLPELSPEKSVIVFCRSGMRAGNAKNILMRHGFSKVVNGGGWEAVAAALKKQVN